MTIYASNYDLVILISYPNVQVIFQAAEYLGSFVSGIFLKSRVQRALLSFLDLPALSAQESRLLAFYPRSEWGHPVDRTATILEIVQLTLLNRAVPKLYL